VATITRSKHGTPAHDVAVLDLSREVAIARQMTDDALRRYQNAVELWEELDGQQRVAAQMEGMRPPHAAEVIACIDVTAKTQAKLAQIEARDSVPVSAVLDFMSQVRALVGVYIPDEQTQKALISAIQQLDIRS
jgi:hypothetical protein